ncbi:helicase-exonuclease AddAB subunit AddB [Paenibacillus sediminis]|uniref:ATP-dependent helicase/deoxyribonuclease subunit B n=1 Tax=Paenibacillus sediminis TaxID=664909 RepID=A0ABS4GYN7_9BACL|nr:helicase-exonuclease AddAB subunit AddB [Paenibacillus sediminis]MBP1935387.1 ATP-dependent helicase/nuclease subunit B [Paenibacillus sediminis]
MSVQFLIGRSGSGKSTYILEQISAKLRAAPDGPPIILLVPEQGSFQAEHALVQSDDIRGTVRAQVLSFRRLAYRVMQEAGGSALVPITDEGKKMLLYKLIRHRKDQLKLFGNSGDQFGFVGRLNDLYTEMKRYCIDPASIEDYLSLMDSSSKGLSLLKDKMADISTLFREFESELSQLYIDDEDNLIKLSEGIPLSSYVRESEIWIDGFHGFTPQEYRVLEQLMKYASSVTISLTLDRPFDDGAVPEELDLFHPAATTYIKLRSIAAEQSIDIVPTKVMESVPLPRFQASPMLSHIERAYERRIPWKDPAPAAPDQSIALYTAVNRRAEVEGVAREILRLAREEQVRYREMAVFVRNIADYEQVIAPLFRDYNIPFFLDQKRSVLHHPLVEFIRGALDVVQRYWRYEDVFRCIKTDFLLPIDGSITRSDMDRLENYVLASGIQGSRWTDGRPWKGAPNLSLETGDEGTSTSREEGLELLERCRTQVTGPLYAFEKRLKKAKTTREMSTAVYLLLEETMAPQRLDLLSHEAMMQGQPQTAKEHRQLWGAVLDLLDQTVEMMGDEQLDLDLFAAMLETGLADLKLSLVPPALDQVLVGNMDRTRANDIKYAFLLGVNDGVLPATFKEEGVLTEQERERLAEIGLELAPGVTRRLLDERFLIYNTLTAASRKLWISYPLADEDGKSLLPSELIRHVRTIFPFLKETFLSDQPQIHQPSGEQQQFIAHPRQTLQHLISQFRWWRQGADISPVWWDVYNWYLSRPEWHEPLERLLQSLFYKNQVSSLTAATSRKLYGKHLKTSVSRMEKFVACAFSHFASYGLRLKERQIYRLKAPDIGQLFHAALSEMAVRFKEENRSWGSLTPDECRLEADIIVDKLAPKLQGEILLSSKRYRYITRKLKDIVGRASVILGEHARRGSFEPVGIELDFGPGRPLPPLTFELENGCTMEIVGRIDRVDMAEDERGILLRVIDYKSSQTDLKLHEVYYGLSLQMLTYLDVLLTYSEQWLGQAALPAGTLYFHVHNPLLQSSNAITQEQADAELLKRFKLKGLVTADRDMIAKMDAELEKGYSSILPVAVKADGGFYSSASVATIEQWDILLGSVRRTITDIGTKITDGDVSIEPYKLKQATPCTHCSFKSVCQFDESIEGVQYHGLIKPDKEQLWKLLRGEEGGELA